MLPEIDTVAPHRAAIPVPDDGPRRGDGRQGNGRLGRAPGRHRLTLRAVDIELPKPEPGHHGGGQQSECDDQHLAQSRHGPEAVSIWLAATRSRMTAIWL